MMFLENMPKLPPMFILQISHSTNLMTCVQLFPTICNNTQSTSDSHVTSCRPMKLTSLQRLLDFILYMKHKNVNNCEYFQWNVSQSLCVNDALAHEVSWSSPNKHIHLGNANASFPCYSGISDGTLVNSQP